MEEAKCVKCGSELDEHGSQCPQCGNFNDRKSESYDASSDQVEKYMKTALEYLNIALKYLKAFSSYISTWFKNWLNNRDVKSINIDSVKSFKTDKSVTIEKINAHIKRQVGKKCKYHVKSEREGNLEIEGKVKEAIFTPVTKFTAAFMTTIEDDKAEIQVSGQTGFTFIFYLLCCAIVTIPVLLVLYHFQKRKPERLIDEILASVTAEYSVR